MHYQKENSLVLTGDAMITKPHYVITLCFQIEDGTAAGKSIDVSMTKYQLQMLHDSLTNWLEMSDFTLDRFKRSREMASIQPCPIVPIQPCDTTMSPEVQTLKLMEIENPPFEKGHQTEF